MIRVSMLRNCPVFCQHRQIGLLQAIGLDSAQKMVHVLVIAGGLKGKQVAFSNQIIELGRDRITVSEAVKYKRAYEKGNMYFVVNRSGLLIGKITDHMIEEKSGRISSVQIMTGYLTREQRKKIWLFAWDTCPEFEDTLRVPDLFSSELFEDIEEA